MPFQKVAKIRDLWNGEKKGLWINGKRILILNYEDKIYAYEDQCLHQGVPLSEGTLTGKRLICKAHQWEYDVCTGRGVNPKAGSLRTFPIKIENDEIWIDIEQAKVFPRIQIEEEPDLHTNHVGPVLVAGAIANAIVEAIREQNKGAFFLDRGSYLRVLAPNRCKVTAASIEKKLGHPFRFPTDLETVLCSFKGIFTVTEKEAVWEFSGAPLETQSKSDDEPEKPKLEGTEEHKTYWHLMKLNRMPTQYEVLSSKLLYYPGKGFEVDVPAKEWYQRYQTDSPFRCSDWELFNDPRETTYAKYTKLQSTKEIYVDGILQSIENSQQNRELSKSWIEFLEKNLAPLLYPFHGFQMIASYFGQIAPSGKIAIASLFQSADEIRRIQRIAYRIRDLQNAHPGFGEKAKTHWEKDTHWQPLRKAVEKLLICYDWGESFVGLNLCLKPRIDDFFFSLYAELGKTENDRFVGEVLFSLKEDAKWQKEWTAALLHTAIADVPENLKTVQAWQKTWDSLAEDAVAGLSKSLPKELNLSDTLKRKHAQFLESIFL